MRFLVCSLFFLLFFSSCDPLIIYYGFNFESRRNLKRINKELAELRIPVEFSYYLNEKYVALIDSIEKIDNQSNRSNNGFRQQPLQIILFDSAHNFITSFTNCDASGFPNLKWSKILPLNCSPFSLAKTNRNLNISEEAVFFNAYASKLNHFEPSFGAKFHIIIYWNYVFGRQNKRLIRHIKRYSESIADSVALYYVNTDFVIY